MSDPTTILKACPCGKVPDDLYVSEGSTYRWLYVEGDCGCGWMIEVRSAGYPNDPHKDYEAAVEGWNDMPRSNQNDQQNDA